VEAGAKSFTLQAVRENALNVACGEYKRIR